MLSEITIEDFFLLNKSIISDCVNIIRNEKRNLQFKLDSIGRDLSDFYQQDISQSAAKSLIFSDTLNGILKKNICATENFFNFISDWERVYQQIRPDYTALFDSNVFIKWNELKKKDDAQNKIDSHNFNILRMFDICETKHSQLLKLLLSSNESHGQDNLFFLIFLEELGIKVPNIGQWNVTVEEGKIDILLKRNDPLSIVVIENKSNWAYDQPNQLYRYWHKTIYHATKQIELDFYNRNKDSFQIIYLTPNSNKYYSSQTVTRPADLPKNFPIIIPMEIKPLSFDEFIFGWLGKCIERLHGDNHRMKEYLKQYQEICTIL